MNKSFGTRNIVAKREILRSNWLTPTLKYSTVGTLFIKLALPLKLKWHELYSKYVINPSNAVDLETPLHASKIFSIPPEKAIVTSSFPGSCIVQSQLCF